MDQDFHGIGEPVGFEINRITVSREMLVKISRRELLDCNHTQFTITGIESRPAVASMGFFIIFKRGYGATK